MLSVWKMHFVLGLISHLYSLPPSLFIYIYIYIYIHTSLQTHTNLQIYNNPQTDQAHFTMTQFSAQATFLIVVIAIGIALDLNDVQTGHLSQAINVLWVTPIFYFGWKLLPNVAAKNTLRDDQSLWTAGFVQNFHTIKSIHKHYNQGLFRYLLAVVFAEAGVNAFTVRITTTILFVFFYSWFAVAFIKSTVTLTHTQLWYAPTNQPVHPPSHPPTICSKIMQHLFTTTA